MVCVDHWTNFLGVDEKKLVALARARRESIRTGNLRPTCAVIRSFPSRKPTKAAIAEKAARRAQAERLRQLDAPAILVASAELEADPVAYILALEDCLLAPAELEAHTAESLTLATAARYALGGNSRDDELVEWVLLPFDRNVHAWGEPPPSVLPHLPESLLGFSAEKARAAYFGEAVLEVEGERPYSPSVYDFESGTYQSQPERANFTSAARLDVPLSFFRTVRDGPRPTLEEWKETFAFIPRFQLLYAGDPGFPEVLLRAAASHREKKLKTAYRRLNGLIGFFEKCQRAKLGVICEKGSA